MAEYREVKTYDIPARMQGKGEGSHPRPKPHIDAATYKSNYQASITKTEGECGGVQFGSACLRSRSWIL